MKEFKGTTQGRNCPILGAKFWKSGVTLKGTVVRDFETKNGKCYEFQLQKPTTINGGEAYPESKEKITTQRVAVGAMKGFGMAVADAIGELQRNDLVEITATGEQDTGESSPMTTFEVKVWRA